MINNPTGTGPIAEEQGQVSATEQEEGEIARAVPIPEIDNEGVGLSEFDVKEIFDANRKESLESAKRVCESVDWDISQRIFEKENTGSEVPVSGQREKFKAAVVIQSAYRGYIARKVYTERLYECVLREEKALREKEQKRLKSSELFLATERKKLEFRERSIVNRSIHRELDYSATVIQNWIREALRKKKGSAFAKEGLEARIGEQRKEKDTMRDMMGSDNEDENDTACRCVDNGEAEAVGTDPPFQEVNLFGDSTQSAVEHGTTQQDNGIDLLGGFGEEVNLAALGGGDNNYKSEQITEGSLIDDFTEEINSAVSGGNNDIANTPPADDILGLFSESTVPSATAAEVSAKTSDMGGSIDDIFGLTTAPNDSDVGGLNSSNTGNGLVDDLLGNFDHLSAPSATDVVEMGSGDAHASAGNEILSHEGKVTVNNEYPNQSTLLGEETFENSENFQEAMETGINENEDNAEDSCDVQEEAEGEESVNVDQEVTSVMETPEIGKDDVNAKKAGCNSTENEKAHDVGKMEQLAGEIYAKCKASSIESLDKLAAEDNSSGSLHMDCGPEDDGYTLRDSAEALSDEAQSFSDDRRITGGDSTCGQIDNDPEGNTKDEDCPAEGRLEDQSFEGADGVEDVSLEVVNSDKTSALEGENVNVVSGVVMKVKGNEDSVAQSVEDAGSKFVEGEGGAKANEDHKIDPEALERSDGVPESQTFRDSEFIPDMEDFDSGDGNVLQCADDLHDNAGSNCNSEVEENEAEKGNAQDCDGMQDISLEPNDEHKQSDTTKVEGSDLGLANEEIDKETDETLATCTENEAVPGGNPQDVETLSTGLKVEENDFQAALVDEKNAGTSDDDFVADIIGPDAGAELTEDPSPESSHCATPRGMDRYVAFSSTLENEKEDAVNGDDNEGNLDGQKSDSGKEEEEKKRKREEEPMPISAVETSSRETLDDDWAKSPTHESSKDGVKVNTIRTLEDLLAVPVSASLSIAELEVLKLKFESELIEQNRLLMEQLLEIDTNVALNERHKINIKKLVDQAKSLHESQSPKKKKKATPKKGFF
eukprot:Nk52_evm80s210 gene=Nk52_evmTU80s210